MLEGTEIAQQRVERPGCITVYALLLVLGGGLLTIGALIFLLGFSIAGLETAEILFFAAGLFGGGYFLILAILSILSGIGIWGMNKWGWWLVVITQVISFGSAVLQPIIQVEGGGGGVDVGVSCAAFGPIIVLAWFLRNRKLFNV